MKPDFPIVLAAIGGILFLLGLLGKITISNVEIGNSNRAIRWTEVLSGAILIASATVLWVSKQPVSNASETPQITGMPQQSAPPSLTGEPPAVDPETLITTIRKKERDNVRESWGIRSDQCFTDVDLEKFKKRNAPAQVSAELQRDNGFIDVVLAIKAMLPNERQKLIDRAARTYHKTWAELALDPATTSPEQLRAGQTEAGQQAERMIAETIADLIRTLCERSADDIRKLYT
jgi:hypothetical protein